MSDDSQPFDLRQAFQNLGGEDEIFASVAEIFLDECPKQLQEISQARIDNDLKQLARAAHKLKGSLAIFAADDAATWARSLEQMAKNEELATFDEAWSNLQTESDKLVRALHQYLSEQKM